ncbi:Clp protease N-terminal domain-containing protein [Nonomuraea jabiensis]|uniref:ATP-dependent Clp protease ATP-binding subunit ClpA n=1 Tax=Nonomuraea jabiensis TaxID=882448 RepID=A0A7W9GC36_9ACTN|nr:ATP-dependent Clp protease ATP-binding subunit ClpA [Nonomuraea jabiensis]
MSFAPLALAGTMALTNCFAGSGSMFEKLTDRARRVVVLSQDEAKMLNHDYIGTEHLLLGLIREGEGVGATVLKNMGLSLEDLRRQVEESQGRGQSVASGYLPFTPSASEALQLSNQESLQRGLDYIGTEHLLLGLIRDGASVAAQVLVELGVDLEHVGPAADELVQQHVAK